ncbi:amidase family protein [Enterovibrio norvegicus]|uniref:amidase family protein n=1 Tax=Enterovibrio norvegicus TaxID=188144 RepID=UPI000C867C5D|nr:amidase family protein [Enterovibrio norvegicus]PMN69228.1 hypothetical protein BCT27_21810 [Enterovibrio norvegicus]
MSQESYLLHKFKPERQDMAKGILARQRLVVSECVGIKGYVTGIGIPAWSDNNEPSKFDAQVVQTIMQSGCRLIGKTQVDDFGTSISGINPFLAKLSNPYSSERRLGGSSSGAALAITQGAATIAVGNDCCGGVIIPAAYNGLYAYRPSPELLDMRGIATVSPSFDAVGVMAKHLPSLHQIAEKCWTKALRPVKLKTVKYASSLFQDLLPIEAMLEWEVFFSTVKVPKEDVATFSKLMLTQAQNIHSVILGREIDFEYGQWLDHYKPKMSQETEEYLKRIRGKSFKEFVETKKKREFFTNTFQGLLSSGELLMIPTSPGPAAENDAFDLETFLINQRRLYAIAEVAGLPQLTLPLLTVDGMPMGISLLALPGEDRLLFDTAERWFI